MKRCSYCGRENSIDAAHCVECGTRIGDDIASADSSGVRSVPQYEFAGLTAEELQQDLVTLLSCRTLGEADLIVSRLASSGIKALIPDEYLMQAICWNLNTYGYVRVQIPPGDYPAAVELLTAPECEDEPCTAPNCGPAMPSGNSDATEGPPSVS